MTRFIGVDLAWQSERNNTGLVVAEGTAAGAEVVACVSGLRSLADVVATVVEFAHPNTVVAVDAPLIIDNVEGRRPCETLISRRFGHAHAGAHSSNLTLYPEPKSVELVRALAAHGFAHGPMPHLGRGVDGRWLFEVYPHPAAVQLFRLDRIIRYKRKRGMTVVEQRAGLERFRALLTSLTETEPPLQPGDIGERVLFGVVLATLKGRALKEHEDLLDAYLCAYIALHYVRFGVERNALFGDLATGYIVVPGPVDIESV